MQLKLLLGLLPSVLAAQLGSMCTPTCFPAQNIVYVDILNGSDANSGACQPHQVNGAAWSACASKSLANGMIKFIANGSGGALGLASGTCERWREQITLAGLYSTAALNHITIAGYGGSSANPLLDASDIITGTDACGISGTYTWVADTGTTWKAAVTSPVDTPLGFVNFFRNGVGPTVGTGVTLATSQANCEATVGTYWPSSTAGGSWTLYYNSGSATNPTSDGNLYEFSSRAYGLDDDNSGPRYLTLQNVDGRRNHTNDGSIVVAEFSTVINVNANDGTKHNALVADGTVINGLTMHNSWFAGVGTTQLVFFDSLTVGAGIVATNIAGSMDVLDGSVGVIYGHFTAGPGFGAVSFTNLSGTNEAYVLQGPWTAASNISCSGCLSGIQFGSTAGTLNGFTYSSPASGGQSALTLPYAGNTLIAANLNMTCSFLNQGCISITGAASLTITGTNTCENLVSGNCLNVASGVTMPLLSISGMTFLQPNLNDSQIVVFVAPTVTVLNGNTYHYNATSGYGGLTWTGTNYSWHTPANVTAWKALGFDAGSTWVNAIP